MDEEALRRVALYGACEACGQPRDAAAGILPDGGAQLELRCPACPGGEFGEVYVTWADDPPNGPRLLITATARRVLITVPLLALIDAGESPWASISDAGLPGEGDPHGYRGSVLRIEAGSRTITYRVGEYLASQRSHVADLQEEPRGTAITGA